MQVDCLQRTCASSAWSMIWGKSKEVWKELLRIDLVHLFFSCDTQLKRFWRNNATNPPHFIVFLPEASVPVLHAGKALGRCRRFTSQTDRVLSVPLGSSFLFYDNTMNREPISLSIKNGSTSLTCCERWPAVTIVSEQCNSTVIE